MALTNQQRFEKFLQQSDFKLTRGRAVISRLVFQTEEVFDYNVIYQAISESHGQICRATIIRTLNLLVQAELLFIVNKETRLFTTSTPCCETEHQKYLAGICPWCGKKLLYGKPMDFAGQ